MKANALAGALALAAGVYGAAALAQQGVQKATLQEQPFPGPTYHTVTVRAVFAPGAEVPPHTHPGIEMAYIVNGQALVKMAGRPDRTLHAGDSFSPSEGVVHSVHNTGSAPLTILSTYVVDRNKPIVIPATGH